MRDCCDGLIAAGRKADESQKFEDRVLGDPWGDKALDAPMAAAAAAASSDGSETKVAPSFLGDGEAEPGVTMPPNESGGTCIALGVRWGLAGTFACGEELSRRGDTMTGSETTLPGKLVTSCCDENGTATLRQNVGLSLLNRALVTRSG